jgi:hypothetical protein
MSYLLTPWSRVLLEKLPGLQLVKKIPVFYGTRRFISVFTSAATCLYPEPYKTEQPWAGKCNKTCIAFIEYQTRLFFNRNMSPLEIYNGQAPYCSSKLL